MVSEQVRKSLRAEQEERLRLLFTEKASEYIVVIVACNNILYKMSLKLLAIILSVWHSAPLIFLAFLAGISWH